MRLRLTPRAQADLITIADYIRSESPAAALRVRDAIRGSLDNIAAFPGLGRAQDTAGIRKLVTRKYGYLVYYAVDENAGEIAVLAIQRPARERPFTDI